MGRTSNLYIRRFINTLVFYDPNAGEGLQLWGTYLLPEVVRCSSAMNLLVRPICLGLGDPYVGPRKPSPNHGPMFFLYIYTIYYFIYLLNIYIYNKIIYIYYIL
jgi:hypothetical protein